MRPLPISKPIEKDFDRFFKKVLKSKNKDGCWWWNGCIDKCGYGVFKLGNKNIKAHRFLLFDKIPEGMLCCHKCDNKECVNPDHIFFGTYLDNSKDYISKGLLNLTEKQYGENKYCAKFKDSDIVYIRSLNLTPYSNEIKQLAKIYNVRVWTIHKIIRRKTWKHIK